MRGKKLERLAQQETMLDVGWPMVDGRIQAATASDNEICRSRIAYVSIVSFWYKPTIDHRTSNIASTLLSHI